MSRPIESTPVFEGQDAIDLLEALEKTDKENALKPKDWKEKQLELARKEIAEFMRPKGFRNKPIDNT